MHKKTFRATDPNNLNSVTPHGVYYVSSGPPTPEFGLCNLLRGECTTFLQGHRPQEFGLCNLVRGKGATEGGEGGGEK